ncbi:hypothetical protein SAMN05518849_104189 [Sphingobium sp. AP50]|uniref:hypothetical protein n=1 Tax=Sphingobium sp. AP50 TaxID=1884369 RepID=UPI0008BDA414|nr:hypothetical protein [Sphingobium sp. AP50]SEJ28025.1 hypothetical protein SAMN05518849_104189 [Sphingobium sp. AP50]
MPPSLVRLMLLPLLFSASTAQALCSYGGRLYAKTIAAQEYHDARWVLRARVIDGKDWESADTSGTLYRLRPIETFKGRLPASFSFSTERNSGGFYLDGASGRPDVGGDYLLFLNPAQKGSAGPLSVRSALRINYSCGQSRPWREVSPSAQAALRHLRDRR